jgi:putative hydrolase of the HAD superfamily
LIQPWPSVGHVYAEVAARHGLPNIPVEALNRQFAAAWKNLGNFNYSRSDWYSLVNQTFHTLAKTPVDETFFSELYREFERAETWHIFDDVLPALQFLRSRGLKLGIISNWDERLRPLLHELKLAPFFQTIVVSCEVGQCKPSPATFHRASELLTSPPNSILHIGDSSLLDVNAAISAGFQALLLARGPVVIPGQLNSLNHLHEMFS